MAGFCWIFVHAGSLRPVSRSTTCFISSLLQLDPCVKASALQAPWPSHTGHYVKA